MFRQNSKRTKFHIKNEKTSFLPLMHLTCTKHFHSTAATNAAHAGAQIYGQAGSADDDNAETQESRVDRVIDRTMPG